jgi:hypothetical protein
MAKGRSPWQDGRRAWERLRDWCQTGSADERAHLLSGAAALDALADVGTVRRLLDQAELCAVRTARRHNKSWAEIATRLGVTRQSAWERWREIDEPEGRAQGATDQLLRDATDAVVPDLLESARERRRQSQVVVPSVVGLAWARAREVLMDSGLVAALDPDGPPLGAFGWPEGAVTDQSPEAGARVPAGSAVRLWFESGGGEGGVREPRRPQPHPKGGRAMLPEPVDDAAG